MLKNEHILYFLYEDDTFSIDLYEPSNLVFLESVYVLLDKCKFCKSLIGQPTFDV